MCNLYSITTNQAAIVALFRVVNRYVGNLPPMPSVFPNYPAQVIRNAVRDDIGQQLGARQVTIAMALLFKLKSLRSAFPSPWSTGVGLKVPAALGSGSVSLSRSEVR
jgi:hypothetical protein